MRWMTIGEVARRVALRTSAIRYYERIGVLPKPVRASGRRQYNAAILERLAIVRFAKHVGFKMTEIKHLLEGVEGRPPPARWRAMATAKARQLQTLVAQARAMHRAMMATLHHECPHLVERGDELAKQERDRGDS